MSQNNDLISRQVAFDELKRISFTRWFECGEYLSEDTREMKIISSNKALEVIGALPSVHPEPREGHWIGGDGSYICSECNGSPMDFIDTMGASFDAYVETPMNYCPNCGAYMCDGGKDA